MKPNGLTPVRLFPDLLRPILWESIDSLPAISLVQQVSKEFKAIVETPEFLHSLLVKFKGPQFSSLIYKRSAKQYLVIDRDLSQIFQTAVCLVNPGVVVICGEYYKVQVSECIEVMVADILQGDGQMQLKLSFQSNVDFLKRIESAFQTPDEMMKRVIHHYEITDIFFANNLLIINHRQVGLKFPDLQEAILGPDYLSAVPLAYELLKSVYVSSSDGEHVRYFTDSLKQQELQAILKTLNSSQLEAYWWSFDGAHRFLLGEVFPNIWPQAKNNIGDEIYNAALNFYLIKAFYSSIRHVGKLDYHVHLHKLILNRLKDPSSGLKAYIENHCTPYCLSLFHTSIFPTIWRSK